jgi:hypothetical protein
MLEKWYLIGSSLLCAVCNITPLAAGQLGYFPENNTCWFTDPDFDIQLRWLIGAQAFWILLMACLEVLSFIVLLGFMLRHQVRGPPPCARSSQTKIAQLRANRMLLNATSTIVSLQEAGAESPIVQYRGIIIRIGTIVVPFPALISLLIRSVLQGLYPLVSCILNFSGTVLDLHLLVDRKTTEEVCFLPRSLRSTD